MRRCETWVISASPIAERRLLRDHRVQLLDVLVLHACRPRSAAAIVIIEKPPWTMARGGIAPQKTPASAVPVTSAPSAARRRARPAPSGR